MIMFFVKKINCVINVQVHFYLEYEHENKLP